MTRAAEQEARVVLDVRGLSGETPGLKRLHLPAPAEAAASHSALPETAGYPA